MSGGPTDACAITPPNGWTFLKSGRVFQGAILRWHPARMTNRDIRCKGCSSLLGKLDESGLTIRRGHLQATMAGDFHASLVCYVPRCRQLNVLTLSTSSPERIA